MDEVSNESGARRASRRGASRRGAAASQIQFRAFKQSCQLSRGLRHKSGFYHIEAMVLAAMLFHLLTLHLQANLANRQE